MERVTIAENGKRRSISKLEASFKQLVNLAASGDLSAMRQLHALIPWLEGQSNDAGASRTAILAVDRMSLARLRERLLDIAQRISNERESDSS